MLCSDCPYAFDTIRFCCAGSACGRGEVDAAGERGLLQDRGQEVSGWGGGGGGDAGARGAGGAGRAGGAAPGKCAPGRGLPATPDPGQLGDRVRDEETAPKWEKVN